MTIAKFNPAKRTSFKNGYFKKNEFVTGNRLELFGSTSSEIEGLEAVIDDLRKHNEFLDAWKKAAEMSPDFFNWPENGDVGCKYDLLPNLENIDRLLLLDKKDAVFICAVWRFCYADKANELLC